MLSILEMLLEFIFFENQLAIVIERYVAAKNNGFSAVAYVIIKN